MSDSVLGTKADAVAAVKNNVIDFASYNAKVKEERLALVA